MQRKAVILGILSVAVLLLSRPDAKAQAHEVGISFVVSGHFLFGPYYRYWIDDHNAVDATVQAAIGEKGEIVFPAVVSAGYKYYAFDKRWRPSLGAQYTLILSPRRSGERETLQLISLVPGVQFRFDDYRMGLEEMLWLSYIKVQKPAKSKVLPLGLESRYGISFK